MNDRSVVAHGALELRAQLDREYPDIFTPQAIAALVALAPLDTERKLLMEARIRRRALRARKREPLGFLDPSTVIPRTRLTAGEARAGAFTGSDIPHDLQRQWIQGTG